MEGVTNRGRPTGSPNRTHYKWLLTVFDKDSNTFRGGKYSTVKEMNEVQGTNWSCDFINRLYTRRGVNPSPTGTFTKKHGHLKLEKINEIRT